MQPPQGYPLVSCILPACGQRRFVSRAIFYFLSQDYPSKELVIVDDDSDPVGDLVPADTPIRHIRLGRPLPPGAQRDRACEEANGSVLVSWEAADWQAPHRLSSQVKALVWSAADICGSSTRLVYDADNRQAWQELCGGEERGVAIGSACYLKTFWATQLFCKLDTTPASGFVAVGPSHRLTLLPDPTYQVGIIATPHGASNHVSQVHRQPYPVDDVRELLGPTWAFYQPDVAPRTTGRSPGTDGPAGRADPPRAAASAAPSVVAARAADLELPEFAAFNHGQSLSRMRRWELPFVLFQSRLPSTGAVLDCTINPENLQDRLARLYPLVLYRHWNPIQQNKFVLPRVPDEAFDRVLCLNTLEHLLKPQREALITSLARALKPGGLFVLTSDYYFDSSWTRPEFLNAGVMRPDRTDIFNGWNKVRPVDWLALCAANGLRPSGAPIEEPREGDSSLYQNLAPYVHAVIGGVFSRSEPRLPPPRKVVLSLLTWNTCSVSVDSARAHLREARLLRRLGYEPFLCICDNGSTDGTREALRALEPEIDVPYKLIFNRENRGNSIGRNQMIDCVLECGADYLLMTDGDIELVPFSSVAMLRYMEDRGHQVGCLGADHFGQTNSREAATPYLYSVSEYRTDSVDQVAYTQYGMFRRALFEEGVRFVDDGPFRGAGWGYEDNDLAFQILTRGYAIERFSGMTYLHRDLRSSVRIMHQLGIDAAKLCEQRKQYVVDKWSRVQWINEGPLAELRQIHIAL